MSVEQRVRDASEQLRSTTDPLPIPAPRFFRTTRRPRVSARAIAFGVVVLILGAAIGVAAIRRDSDTEGRLSTVAPTTATTAGDPDAAASHVRFLPKFTGIPAKAAVATLTSLALRYEIRLEDGADIVWVWIGPHAEYDKLVQGRA